VEKDVYQTTLPSCFTCGSGTNSSSSSLLSFIYPFYPFHLRFFSSLPSFAQAAVPGGEDAAWSVNILKFLITDYIPVKLL
jgi:hypothetical protein